MRKLRVCLDPGHGGRDPGAVRGALVEKLLNLELAVIVERALKRAGHDISRTRIHDEYVSLRRRCHIANVEDAHTDIFISLHHNSFGSTNANGFEVLHYPTSEVGSQLAKHLCDKVCSKVPKMRNRGPKPRGNLTVLKKTTMPAILIEAGFISSTKNREILLDDKKRKKFYRIIAKSIVEVLDEVSI